MSPSTLAELVFGQARVVAEPRAVLADDSRSVVLDDGSMVSHSHVALWSVTIVATGCLYPHGQWWRSSKVLPLLAQRGLPQCAVSRGSAVACLVA